MKQSDLNHLRRLLGWIRCDIGQSPAELQQTMIDVAKGLGHPEISQDAKARMVETYRRAESIPLYVRAAVKALEKVLSNGGPHRGVDATCATAETHYFVDVEPGAEGRPGMPLTDIAVETGLAEIGITAWGPRAEDWVAGAQYTVRLLQQALAQAAAKPLADRPNAAGNPVACRDTPAAPPTLRWYEGGGAAAPQASEAVRKALQALEAAQRFIRNGVEFGYIRMPDADTPDPAHRTPGLIDAAIRALKTQADKDGAVCSCPTGDGSLRHPCAVHPTDHQQPTEDAQEHQP